MAHAGKGIGAHANGQHGAKPAGPEIDENYIDESDLASTIMGKNKLHGDTQGNFTNQRQAVAGEKLETDGLIESFEKLDKEVRAREDLGKGNRSGGH